MQTRGTRAATMREAGSGTPSAPPRSEALRAALAAQGFHGDVEDGIGPRLVAATDNSIYQVMPVAVLHPRTGADINAAVRAGACRARARSLAARRRHRHQRPVADDGCRASTCRGT